ncbi:MAG: sarcosine oxidase subunit delta family protein [Rhizobiaceae bacterium]|nr:sarcosine oxidase subunit delta family protein [Rhizobiaceae bacterium]
MRISCPYCGQRDVVEFTYQGDATVERPDPASIDQNAWNAFVYDRANPAGRHRELWQHSGGCRAHLVVERDTVNHVIHSVAFAGEKQSPKTASKRKSPSRRKAAS